MLRTSQSDGTSGWGVSECGQETGDTVTGPAQEGEDALTGLSGSAVEVAGLVNPDATSGSRSATSASGAAVDVGPPPGSMALSEGDSGAGGERGTGGVMARVPAMNCDGTAAAGSPGPGLAGGASGTGSAGTINRLASAADTTTVVELVPRASLLRPGGSLRLEGALRLGLPGRVRA